MAQAQQCRRNLCNDLFEQRRDVFRRNDAGELNIINLPPPGTGGIYAIFHGNEAIYIGKSNENIRERLMTHLNFRGTQAIDDHFRYLPDDDRILQKYTISYVEVANPSCVEHDFIQCISNKQNKWPRYNERGGNAVCE